MTRKISRHWWHVRDRAPLTTRSREMSDSFFSRVQPLDSSSEEDEIANDTNVNVERVPEIEKRYAKKLAQLQEEKEEEYRHYHRSITHLQDGLERSGLMIKKGRVTVKMATVKGQGSFHNYQCDVPLHRDAIKNFTDKAAKHGIAVTTTGQQVDYGPNGRGSGIYVEYIRL